MKILVCVKQVPQTDRVRFQPGINRIVRDGVPVQLNPLDAAALGHALALRSGQGGEVVTVTMGPPEAREVLLDTIDAGADRAIHLVDMRFAGADTLATARALARVVAREHPDLVLLGRSTVDGGTAQVAPQLAEFAGLAQSTHVITIDATAGELVVSRETEAGAQRWQVPLPAVVSVEDGPSLPDGRATGQRPAPIEEVDADALGGDPAGYGIRGSATYVQRVVDLPGSRGRRVTSDPEEVARLVDRGDPRSASSTVAAVGAARDIWVVAEEYGDGLHPVTAEAIAAAYQVAPRLDAAVTAVVLAESVGKTPALLAAAGAERVLVVQHPRLGTYAPETYASALAALVAQRAPFAVLGGWTSRGRDFLPRVAARLGAGMTGDVVGLDVDPHPGDASTLDLVWLKPAWAGTALARVVARTVPSFGTLRPGAVPAPAPRVGGDATVELVTGEPDSWRSGAEPADADRSRPIDVPDRRADVLLDACPTVLLLGVRADRATVDAAARLAHERGWGLAGTAAAVAAGQVPAYAELSLRKRSLSPQLVVGIGLAGVADLDCVRGAKQLVVVDVSPTTGITEVADLVGEFTPAEFFAALTSPAATRT